MRRNGYEMPEIHLEEIVNEVSADDLAICKMIVKDGRLRASKPKVDENVPESGIAAYLWRLVAFFCSPIPKHHYLPVTADFDLPSRLKGRYFEATEEERAEDRAYRRAAKERGDRLEKLITERCVSKRDWHGVRRWGQVMGQVGTPRYDEEGAVIYR